MHIAISQAIFAFLVVRGDAGAVSAHAFMFPPTREQNPRSSARDGLLHGDVRHRALPADRLNPFDLEYHFCVLDVRSVCIKSKVGILTTSRKVSEA